jgi:hypothetical protein
MNTKGIWNETAGWIHVAQDKVQQRALANVVTNIRVASKEGRGLPGQRLPESQ